MSPIFDGIQCDNVYGWRSLKYPSGCGDCSEMESECCADNLQGSYNLLPKSACCGCHYGNLNNNAYIFFLII